MSHYSIKELEKLSGIKAHTIRIWEKRYRVVSPGRSRTNIRYYSDEDLKKIINISLLNRHGSKISRIAKMSESEIAARVQELSATGSRPNVHIDQLIVAMINLEEDTFEKALAYVIRKMGFERAVTEIVYAFLEKIGLLWQTGNISPGQEHFISNLIRQKMIAAIDSLPPGPQKAPRVLLFLHEQELHELGLLFYHYIAKKEGLRCYYLGQMVPYTDVMAICKSHHPDFLVTAITGAPSGQSVERYLHSLCRDEAECIVLAAGRVLRKMALRIPANLHLFNTPDELRLLLRSKKQR